MTGSGGPAEWLRGITAGLFGGGLVVVTVRGVSMEPTYRDGDRVLVCRRGTPRPGRVVVIERPDGPAWTLPPVPPEADAAALRARRWAVKRVAAVAGDPVPADRVPALVGEAGRRVPQGRLVLLGDNADFSLDSRSLGYFPQDRVLGLVLVPTTARSGSGRDRTRTARKGATGARPPEEG